MSLFDLEWKTTINEEDIKRMNEAINRLFILKKPNNSAPKSIKGDYDLSIHGNKIVLVDNIEGTSVEAKCSPEDNSIIFCALLFTNLYLETTLPFEPNFTPPIKLWALSYSYTILLCGLL